MHFASPKSVFFYFNLSCIKVTVHRFYTGVHGTVSSSEILFNISILNFTIPVAAAIDLMGHGSVQNDPPVAVTAPVDRSVTPYNLPDRSQGSKKLNPLKVYLSWRRFRGPLCPKLLVTKNGFDLKF